MKGRRRWYRNPIFWIAFVVAIGVVIRLVLDPIATHFTRKALAESPDYRGTFERVHVSILPPGYEIHRLVLRERDAPAAREPFVRVESARGQVDWHELLHGRLAARLRVDDPKISIVKTAPSEKKPPARPPSPRRELQKQRALRIERIEVRGGEVNYRDLTEKGHPDLWLHDFEVAVENLATRPALSHGRPVTVSATGMVGRSGHLTAFLTANPWAEGLTFAGRVELRDLPTAELYAFVEPKTGVQVPQGTIDLFVEFEARDGEITGGVKPVLKNVKVRPADDDLGDRLKAWAADKTLKIFSDRVPDRNAVATVVPIKGRITDPDIQIMPAVLGIVRNAFVEGVRSGFAHLPPGETPKKQGVLEQAKDALQKGKGPPKAQPSSGSDGK
jgi:hypothetical protein